MAATPPTCEFGWKAVDFTLPATAGRSYSLADIAGPNGTLIAFICNHCPYVTSVIDRLVATIADVQALGIGVAAISANDANDYPTDSFPNMKIFADTHGFTIASHNINVSLEPGEHSNMTFVANRAGVYPLYCTEFCSALHLEMAGYLLVEPQ